MINHKRKVVFGGKAEKFDQNGVRLAFLNMFATLLQNYENYMQSKQDNNIFDPNFEITKGCLTKGGGPIVGTTILEFNSLAFVNDHIPEYYQFCS